MPQLANNAIESYIFHTKMELDNFELSNHYSNLSKQEWLALQSLKQRTEIIIKKADKNNQIVILNKTSYIKQGELHTGNIHYEKLDYPYTSEIAKELLARESKQNQPLIDFI